MSVVCDYLYMSQGQWWVIQSAVEVKAWPNNCTLEFTLDIIYLCSILLYLISVCKMSRQKIRYQGCGFALH